MHCAIVGSFRLLNTEGESPGKIQFMFSLCLYVEFMKLKEICILQNDFRKRIHLNRMHVFSDKEHLGQRGLVHLQGERDTAQGGFPLTHRFYVGYARVFHWLYVRN